jgi:queuine tRNA-ribosyltransferase
MALGFDLIAKDPLTAARRGRVRTAHGTIETPAFMPVGTMASVKTLDLSDLAETGAEIILGNTYHLLLRPGKAVFEKFGGIHGFTGWRRPVLTDSGGYQIFCLPHHCKISEAGAAFRSYVDGRFHMLSPETSIGMQEAIGSDIMMVLDRCITSTADHATTREAMELTHRWALRSLAARTPRGHALFAIVQGGVFADLRRESAAFLTQHPFDGFAIGGLAVGETKAEREDFTELAAGLLPADKPRYLMGVGTPIDLLEAVRRGVDMFDCVIPTLFAQQGIAFTSVGKINVTPVANRLSEEPLDPACACRTCATYSLGYLHHLHKCKEPTGWRLLSLHNQVYYQTLMAGMRLAIMKGEFDAFYKSTKAAWLTREGLVRAPKHRPSKARSFPPAVPADQPTMNSSTGAYSPSESSPAP